MDEKQVYENQETAIKLLEENVELKKIIKEVREYIEWHYDLGTKKNIEFCLLRDRLLEILDRK